MEKGGEVDQSNFFVAQPLLPGESMRCSPHALNVAHIMAGVVPCELLADEFFGAGEHDSDWFAMPPRRSRRTRASENEEGDENVPPKPSRGAKQPRRRVTRSMSRSMARDEEEEEGSGPPSPPRRRKSQAKVPQRRRRSGSTETAAGAPAAKRRRTAPRRGSRRRSLSPASDSEEGKEEEKVPESPAREAETTASEGAGRVVAPAPASGQVGREEAAQSVEGEQSLVPASASAPATAEQPAAGSGASETFVLDRQLYREARKQMDEVLQGAFDDATMHKLILNAFHRQLVRGDQADLERAVSYVMELHFTEDTAGMNELLKEPDGIKLEEAQEMGDGGAVDYRRMRIWQRRPYGSSLLHWGPCRRWWRMEAEITFDAADPQLLEHVEQVIRSTKGLDMVVSAGHIPYVLRNERGDVVVLSASILQACPKADASSSASTPCFEMVTEADIERAEASEEPWWSGVFVPFARLDRSRGAHLRRLLLALVVQAALIKVITDTPYHRLFSVLVHYAVGLPLSLVPFVSWEGNPPAFDVGMSAGEGGEDLMGTILSYSLALLLSGSACWGLSAFLDLIQPVAAWEAFQLRYHFLLDAIVWHLRLQVFGWAPTVGGRPRRESLLRRSAERKPLLAAGSLLLGLSALHAILRTLFLGILPATWKNSMFAFLGAIPSPVSWLLSPLLASPPRALPLWMLVSVAYVGAVWARDALEPWRQRRQQQTPSWRDRVLRGLTWVVDAIVPSISVAKRPTWDDRIVWRRGHFVAEHDTPRELTYWYSMIWDIGERVALEEEKDADKEKEAQGEEGGGEEGGGGGEGRSNGTKKKSEEERWEEAEEAAMENPPPSSLGEVVAKEMKEKNFQWWQKHLRTAAGYKPPSTALDLLLSSLVRARQHTVMSLPFVAWHPWQRTLRAGSNIDTRTAIAQEPSNGLLERILPKPSGALGREVRPEELQREADSIDSSLFVLHPHNSSVKPRGWRTFLRDRLGLETTWRRRLLPLLWSLLGAVMVVRTVFGGPMFLLFPGEVAVSEPHSWTVQFGHPLQGPRERLLLRETLLSSLGHFPSLHHLLATALGWGLAATLYAIAQAVFFPAAVQWGKEQFRAILTPGGGGGGEGGEPRPSLSERLQSLLAGLAAFAGARLQSGVRSALIVVISATLLLVGAFFLREIGAFDFLLPVLVAQRFLIGGSLGAIVIARGMVFAWDRAGEAEEEGEGGRTWAFFAPLMVIGALLAITPILLFPVGAVLIWSFFFLWSLVEAAADRIQVDQQEGVEGEEGGERGRGGGGPIALVRGAVFFVVRSTLQAARAWFLHLLNAIRASLELGIPLFVGWYVAVQWETHGLDVGAWESAHAFGVSTVVPTLAESSLPGVSSVLAPLVDRVVLPALFHGVVPLMRWVGARLSAAMDDLVRPLRG